jgi:hypothetical protein
MMEEEKNKGSIVCGTDFSATAVEAVDIAAAMAKRLETKLVLVHVDEFHGMAAVDPTLFEATLSPVSQFILPLVSKNGCALDDAPPRQ